MLKKIINLYMTLVFSLFSMSAIAQVHLHEGDIQPWKIGAEIFVKSNLFEPDFGDIGGGLYATDEPGFDVNIAKGAFSRLGIGCVFNPSVNCNSGMAPNGARLCQTESGLKLQTRLAMLFHIVPTV